jgi:peptide/nickel transport system permease protein
MTALAEVRMRGARAIRLRPSFAWLPATVIAVYAVTALVGPFVLRFDPVETRLADRLLAPGATTSTGGTALLGTDALGRDMLAQVVYGARTSMTIGLLTVLVCTVVGLFVGVIAGYQGGIVDSVLSRGIDVLLAFPGIVLAIVVAGLFDRSVAVVVVALSLTGWIRFARLARGETLSLRERDWVLAARVLGVRTPATMVRHILPFLVGPVAALVTLEFGLVVLSEAGLSFLGIGLPSGVVSWGQVIANGKEYLGTAWWISAFPGFALALLVVCVGLLGDHLNARYQRGGDIASAETTREARARRAGRKERR